MDKATEDAIKLLLNKEAANMEVILEGQLNNQLANILGDMLDVCNNWIATI